MNQFHPLTVTDIHRTIRHAVVLTYKQDFDGTVLRRNYSICPGLDDDKLQVGIKRVDGGAFPTLGNQNLKVGDTLHAIPPQDKCKALFSSWIIQNAVDTAFI